ADRLCQSIALSQWPGLQFTDFAHACLASDLILTAKLLGHRFRFRDQCPDGVIRDNTGKEPREWPGDRSKRRHHQAGPFGLPGGDLISLAGFVLVERNHVGLSWRSMERVGLHGPAQRSGHTRPAAAGESSIQVTLSPTERSSDAGN